MWIVAKVQIDDAASFLVPKLKWEASATARWMAGTGGWVCEADLRAINAAAEVLRRWRSMEVWRAQ